VDPSDSLSIDGSPIGFHERTCIPITAMILREQIQDLTFLYVYSYSPLFTPLCYQSVLRMVFLEL